MTITDMKGLYVHIPFCIRKCNYCDFCSFQDISKKDREAYISALEKDILSYRRDTKIPLETLFFGGGTPSLLEPYELEKICFAISNTFDLSKLVEFTAEANPKTLSPEKLSAFKSFGVNRISMGLQSIHENELLKLGRIHNLSDFLESLTLARSYGFENINVDLMYGIPEQTEKSFRESLKFVTELEVPHLSVYGLMIEEGTPFFKERAVLPLPDEDTEADMYYGAAEFLASHGYNHYEISNYAKDGFESRHNLKYWHNEEYIGVGISAYSYFGGVRYGNTNAFSDYISELKDKRKNESRVSKTDEAYDFAMLALRLKEGFSLAEYNKRFGTDFLSGREEKILKYVSLGLLLHSGGRISLTEKGFYLSNTVLSDLL